MLYTTEQIAKMYNVSSYTITRRWVPAGLKHMHGAGKGFIYKKEWVEEFLEEQAEITTKVVHKQKTPRRYAKATFTKVV